MTRRNFITAGLTALLAPYSLVRVLCGWKQGGKVTTVQDAKETSGFIYAPYAGGKSLMLSCDDYRWVGYGEPLDSHGTIHTFRIPASALPTAKA